MSKAIYKENSFSIYWEPMQYKFEILPWILFSSSGCSQLGNNHMLFALLWFDIAHKNIKICLITDRLLLRFRVRYPQD